MSDTTIEPLPISWSPTESKDGNLDPSVSGSQADYIMTFLAKAVNAMFVAHQTKNMQLFGLYFEPNLQLGIIGHNELLDAHPETIEIEHASTLSGAYLSSDLQMRVRLSVLAKTLDGISETVKMYIDFASVLNNGYTVLSNCPNCGAPVDSGSHLCSFCKVDVRVMNAKTFKIVKVQFY
jgi:hypothetical protein